MTENLTPDEADALFYWSQFGRKPDPSTNNTTRADPSGWKTVPFLAPVTSPWDQKVPRADLQKLLNGFTPLEMEDKWFVYAEGPNAQGGATVHMFRSWTGQKMVEVRLRVPLRDGKVVDEDSRIRELVWESSPERYRGQTEEGAKGMVREVCRWCMDVNLK